LCLNFGLGPAKAELFTGTKASLPSTFEIKVQSEVKVRLEKAMKRISVEGMGLRVSGLRTNPRVKNPEITRVDLTKDRKGAFSVNAFNGLELVQSFSVNEKSLIIIRGDELKIENKKVPGFLIVQEHSIKESIQSKSAKLLDVIGVVPLETYIVGVLAKEIPLSWPLEAMKAQAVAVRSYTLAVMEERRKSSFHLESTVDDQVFSYISKSRMPRSEYKNVILAVTQTEKLVLKDAKNRNIKAFYHSHCGGQTENPKDVWGGDKLLGHVKDPYCVAGKDSNWTYFVSRAELEKRISQQFNFPRLASLASSSSKNSRLYFVDLRSQDGFKKQIRADELRQVLGYDKLKSAKFSARSTDDGYEFKGSGLGHGVGLCQWGSKVQASQGKKYREILQFYYPTSRVSQNETHSSAQRFTKLRSL
ncbi:MAG: SpoIID/LytB domain-containing protein, partial [Pseudobdellovibrionaceae bacterium]